MGREQQRRPTINDVAAMAGVSTATVSRYINNPRLVSAATGQRIEQAIMRSDYVPNLVAGGLATSRSRLVALLIPDIAPSVFNDTIEAMVDELSADGQVVMLGLTGQDNHRMPELIRNAIGRRADAIILTGILTDPASRELLASHGTTVIETWGLPDNPIDIAVGFQHREVGEAVARFAIERGYRRPHLLTARGARATERRDGFVCAWGGSGHATPTEELFDSPTRFGQGRAAFRAIRRLGELPDLVVCSSDWLAQGVLVEAHAAGVKVPDDLAVIGFGNLALAAEMRPTITTVDIDGARIGREAVRILRARAAGEPDVHRCIDVGFRIIGRDSG